MACDNYHVMLKRAKTMTQVLKQAIAQGGETYTAIESTTGVKRASIMRFMRGEQSLRLDLADKLAEHFGIEPKRKGR